MTNSRITFEPGRFYVMDRFAYTVQDAYVAGPFDTREAADKDRRERNIADDCEVCEVPSNPNPDPDTESSASRQHFIDTGRYLTRADFCGDATYAAWKAHNPDAPDFLSIPETDLRSDR